MRNKKYTKEEILKLFTLDFCNYAEYNDEEFAKCISGVLKEVYKKINELN